MARILITSGPTRQYIDPVRYLSNASSGRMGCCLAAAAIAQGHEVLIVSGPVTVAYPPEADVIEVVSTEEMLEAAQSEFGKCDGLIGAAAPCDYRPIEVACHKIRKTGETIDLQLVETPDVVATLGRAKRTDQWTVGFALETDDARFRALTKLQKKFCDLVILNGVAAIDSAENQVEIICQDGSVLRSIAGSKQQVATEIISVIEHQLVQPRVAR